MIKHGHLGIPLLANSQPVHENWALGKRAVTTGEIGNLEGRHGFVFEIG